MTDPGSSGSVGAALIAVSADDWATRLAAAHREEPIAVHADLESALTEAGTTPTVILARADHPSAALAGLGSSLVDLPSTDVVLVLPTVDVDHLRAAMVAGVRDVLADTGPEDSGLWGEVQAARQRLGESAGAKARHPGRVVNCTTAAGGQGASVIAANLAIALADHGTNRVVLVEGDHRFGDMREMMGLLGITSGGETVDDRYAETWLGDYMHTHESSGVTVLLPPVESATMDDFPPAVVIEGLGLLQSIADFIVVDSPFWITETYKMAAWSDLTMLVTRDAPRYLAKARTAARALSGYEATTRLVISDYVNGRTPRRKDLAAKLGLETIGRIPETTGIDETIADGVPRILSDPDGDFAVAIAELADALVAQTNQSAPESGQETD